MITKKDAIAIGSAIVAGLKREEADPRMSGTDNKARYHARGAVIHAMDNLWYDVIPQATRASFNYSKDEFFAACKWE